MLFDFKLEMSTGLIIKLFKTALEDEKETLHKK